MALCAAVTNPCPSLHLPGPDSKEGEGIWKDASTEKWLSPNQSCSVYLISVLRSNAPMQRDSV